MAQLPRQQLLQGASFRDPLVRVLDLAEQALKTWTVTYSDFLPPGAVAEIGQRLASLADVHWLSWGGYAQAERQRLALARAETPLELESIPVQAIEIQGNFLFDPAGHRDFRGALLGTGLVPEKIGDILVLGEQGAQALLVPELVDYVQMHLTQVRTVPVKVRPISLSELKVRPPRVKELQTVEASLRLDAVASAGFGISRSKMVAEIERGEVRVNWQTVLNSHHPLQSGDLVSVTGRGRLEIGEIQTTQKGRYRIHLKRFL
ncbi:MAG: photosystem II S4 domain protein [Thermostichales cyanobacterium SRBZ-1_bins_19]